MKKISYCGLKKVLSPKEMKNITGGSDNDCNQSECAGDCTITVEGRTFDGECILFAGVVCGCVEK